MILEFQIVPGKKRHLMLRPLQAESDSPSSGGFGEGGGSKLLLHCCSQVVMKLMRQETKFVLQTEKSQKAQVYNGK